MIFIQLSAFILLVMGIVRVLELTPERINKDLSGFFEKRESLQDMSRVARGKKKQNKIVKELSRIRRILTETGKEKNFSVALTLSLILMVSVSDIVQVWDGGEEEVGFYFCDSFGFKKVEFDPTKTVDRSKENFITALLIKPGCEPEKVQIGRDLRSLQAAVEGDIEQFPCFADDAVIICNEEGKLEGLPLNRAVREEYELELPYCELKKRLRAAEREKSGSLVGYIVFTEDSFDKTYPIEARTYMVSSNNKAFQDGMGGYSIYGSSVDGEDLCVRLDGYMKDEHGGTNGWKIEKCYVYQDEKEIIDIIAGNFLIVNAPLESEHYESLSFGQLQKYRKKFENPEHFVRYFQIHAEIQPVGALHQRIVYRPRAFFGLRHGYG